MKRIAVAVFLMALAAMVFAQAPQAIIKEMSGTVELKASGAADWKAAKSGDKIAQSTVISTGFKSTAILAVGSSTFTVRPLTRLSLDALLSRDNVETINVGLRTGRIQVDVKPPAGSRTDFTVQTPSATASVRGTVFDIDPVKLKVSEGNVVYASSGEQARPVMVAAGQQSQVDTNTGKAANPDVLAEATRSVPALAGMASASGAESSGRVSLAQGTVAVEIEINAGN
jgi:hypothetical protein